MSKVEKDINIVVDHKYSNSLFTLFGLNSSAFKIIGGCDITSLCISKWDEKPNFGFSSHLLTPLIFKVGPYRDQFHNV